RIGGGVLRPGHRGGPGDSPLPILPQGGLMGGVDARRPGAEGRLGARHVHFEPWFAAGQRPPSGGDRLDCDEAMRGLGDSLSALGTFVGADEVVVRRGAPRRARPGLAAGGTLPRFPPGGRATPPPPLRAPPPPAAPPC